MWCSPICSTSSSRCRCACSGPKSGRQKIARAYQGSIQAITNASGVEQQRQIYRPYGGRLSTSSSHVESRGYTGQRQDESGLFYLHARYYDPELGRFISADPTVPTGRSVGLNRYAYAGNDPVNFTDIDGMGLFSKLKKFFKKLVSAIKKVIKKIARALRKLAAKIAKIPIIGGILALPLEATGALLMGDFKAFARAVATMAIMVVAAVLTVMTAGLATPLYILANAAIGFVSGAGIALVNGASMKDALRAGLIGAAVSAASAALSRGLKTTDPKVTDKQAGSGEGWPNLESPTNNSRAAWGGGPAQEANAFFGPINRALPTSTNISAFVHEAIYPNLGLGSGIVPSLATQPIITIPTFMAIAPLEMVVRYPALTIGGSVVMTAGARGTSQATSSTSYGANGTGQPFGLKGYDGSAYAF